MLLACIQRSNVSTPAIIAARCITASFSSAAQSPPPPPPQSAGDNSNATPTPPKQQQQVKARRRTRRRTLPDSSTAASVNIPSLADFMHRAKVRKQYRNFIRLAQFVDGKDANGGTNTPGECRAALEEVRLSYKLGMKKGGLDELAKNMAYSEGERRQRELEAIVGYSPTSAKQTNKTNNDEAKSSESYDEDSWINIQDIEDPRGRVGVQWPWQMKGEEETSK